MAQPWLRRCGPKNARIAPMLTTLLLTLLGLLCFGLFFKCVSWFEKI